MWTYLNDQWVPRAAACLSLNDAGFVLGATVTDLCRTFRRALYRWNDHLRRFRTSCALAQIDPGMDDETITRLVHELLRRNATSPSEELCLVVFATPGPIGYYLGEPGGAGDAPPTFGMHTFPLPAARYRKLIEHGADLITPTIRQLPAASVDPRIKQRSRLHWWLAEREVQASHPGAQALLLDEKGNVTETAAANFLIVKNGVILSPPAGTVLDGVSLRVVRELCGRLGTPFEERPLTLGDCLAAEEAILTSTPYCLAAVRSLNGYVYSFPGRIFQQLRDAWSVELSVDIHAPFRGAS